MEKIQPYLTAEYGGLLGLAVVVLALSLRAMGILSVVVSFWSGFAFCLGIQAFAIYHFLAKAEAKTNDKLEAARKLNTEVTLLIEEAATSDLVPPGERGISTPTKLAGLATSRANSTSNLGIPRSPSTTSLSTSTEIAAGSNGAAPPAEVKTTLEGNLTIQFVGKKKARNVYQCVLKGGILYYKKRPGIGSGSTKSSQATSSSGTASPGPGSSKDGASNGELKQIVLTGAQIRRLEEVEMKGVRYAIEVLHPERKIVYKIDYLYLIAESEMDLERWYFALLTCCVPHNGYVDVELNKLLHDRFKYMWRSQETANWLSALWARMHLNMRVSQSLREKMINKVALRLSEKIEEKGYEQYIGNLQITDLDFGSKPPTIESAMIQPPDSSGDLIADVWLHYRNGDASLTLSCEVNFKRIMIIPIAVTVSCKSLSGKLQMRVPPFPAERFSISFYEEPTMDLVIEMAIGEKAGQMKNLILPKIKDIILGRLKLAIVERFVAPHRKYFRIPGTAKKDPQSDKPAQFAVKTSLKTLPTASTAPSSASPSLTASPSSTSLSKNAKTTSALSASSSSVTSDDDFANWSPAVPRNTSSVSVPEMASSASSSDLKSLGVPTSSASATLPQTSGGGPGSQLQQPSRSDIIRLSLESSNSKPELLETATYEERVMSPNMGSSLSSARNSLTGEQLAAELDAIGLAPVPQTHAPAGSSRHGSPSRKTSHLPAGDESRLSTKVKGIFRSYFPKNDPNAPQGNLPK
jgi:hypothetical protein